MSDATSILERTASAERPIAALRRDHPGIPAAPSSPARAAIARRMFAHRVRHLDLRVLWPDGRITGGGGPDAPALRLVRPDAFFNRLGAHLKIGFGEAYQAGDWEAESDLADVLGAFAARLDRLVPPGLQRLRGLLEPVLPAAEDNTVAGSRENIHRHYDLSNDLFELFLDETMTYSAAIFAGPSDRDLPSAQRRKMDSILDLAGVRPGMHVLEIGTGWGGLAMHAAATRGARVTTLTISAEQRALAQERIAAAGLSELVEVRLEDYREAAGTYDAIVSVEMLEAVGERWWPTFFGGLERLLAPGGRIGIQTITMPHARYLASRRHYGWIHKYIFPGGLIPSREALDRVLAEHTGLAVLRDREIGLDYARTLRLWRERFTERADAVDALGFDETFRRTWAFYLAYCEAGFAHRVLGDAQLAIGRP